ncbi:MAG TPA: tetraacyldisaccharide 4'-kinase [Thermoanaerobaculia bacterium]|nr:tetraacyldisaccharide 4'-kinase [Thermoanaerobaculia bacterium]
MTLLKPLELLYRGLNRARRALYRRGVLKRKRLARPVISVGNISVGGAGKTPAVIAICRFLTERGLRVVVLTRGYKTNDEPELIKRQTKCDVLIGKNRYDNAKHYLKSHYVDAFVLDDGFQHLQLHRDLDVVIDAPARFHREGHAALRDAHIVIPRRLRTLVPEELRGQRVFAFAGLADNEQFFRALEGVHLTGTKSFPDHHPYTKADLEAIQRAAGDARIVTTEKDAVKIDEKAITAIPAEFDIDADVLERIAAAATAPEQRKRKRRKNPLLQRLEYAVYRLVVRAVKPASEEAVYRWGTRLGALAGIVLRRRTRLAMRNLRGAFPRRSDEELREILAKCWRHFGREMLLYVQMQSFSLEQIAERCPLVNVHHLEEAIARGKGTLLMSGHWGGWEIGGLAVMALLRNVRSVARPLDNEFLERDLQRLRERTGAEVIDRRRAARFLMKSLAGNGVVALLPDQAVQPREGVLVPFLGRPAWTTPAPARMALKGDSTIVFGFCIPDGLRHRLEFEEPIRVDELAEGERDPVVLTKRINDVIARRIHSRPELWLWMHDRWKGTGESEVMHGV